MNFEEDGQQTEAHVEATGKLYELLDFCHKHDLDFEEVLESARQSWMPAD